MDKQSGPGKSSNVLSKGRFFEAGTVLEWRFFADEPRRAGVVIGWDNKGVLVEAPYDSGLSHVHLPWEMPWQTVPRRRGMSGCVTHLICRGIPDDDDSLMRWVDIRDDLIEIASLMSNSTAGYVPTAAIKRLSDMYGCSADHDLSRIAEHWMSSECSAAHFKSVMDAIVQNLRTQEALANFILRFVTKCGSMIILQALQRVTDRGLLMKIAHDCPDDKAALAAYQAIADITTEECCSLYNAASLVVWAQAATKIQSEQAIIHVCGLETLQQEHQLIVAHDILRLFSEKKNLRPSKILEQVLRHGVHAYICEEAMKELFRRYRCEMDMDRDKARLRLAEIIAEGKRLRGNQDWPLGDELLKTLKTF